jgi:hypothetical protein
MNITWCCINNLYNIGLVGEYITYKLALDIIRNDEILKGNCHHA